GDADDTVGWPTRGQSCPPIASLLQTALNQATSAVRAEVQGHLEHGCNFCKLYYDSFRQRAGAGEWVAPAAESATEVRLGWVLSMAAKSGEGFSHVYVLRLSGDNREVVGWIELQRPPADGYWQARLRFPLSESKLVTADN